MLVESLPHFPLSRCICCCYRFALPCMVDSNISWRLCQFPAISFSSIQTYSKMKTFFLYCSTPCVSRMTDPLPTLEYWIPLPDSQEWSCRRFLKYELFITSFSFSNQQCTDVVLHTKGTPMTQWRNPWNFRVSELVTF